MRTPGATALPENLRETLRSYLATGEGGDVFDRLNGLRDALHEMSPNTSMPVDMVRWVDIDRVTPNDYNPNHVARVEMGLLLKSINADGYTQPVVTVWNPDRRKVCPRCSSESTVERVVQGGVEMVAVRTARIGEDCDLCFGVGEVVGMFEIVDGFHRYFTMRSNDELRERCHNRLPIVVIDKSINDRMASTVRHNRARGKHSIEGMANMVYAMLDQGWSDEEICNELGMEAEEVVRLKHITGFSKLFKNTDYNRAWVTKNQIRLREAQEARERNESSGVTLCRSCFRQGNRMMKLNSEGLCYECAQKVTGADTVETADTDGLTDAREDNPMNAEA